MTASRTIISETVNVIHAPGAGPDGACIGGSGYGLWGGAGWFDRPLELGTSMSVDFRVSRKRPS